MWKIDNLTFDSNVILAPMAGFTSFKYREFMKPFGVAYSVTEMVSDAGLTYGNKETLSYLETSPIDTPLAIQLFGNDTKLCLSAIDVIENMGVKYDMIDINLGCSVPKVFNNKAGAYWCKFPNKLYEHMKAIVEHSKKPVTAKIRLGYDDKHINYMEVIEVLQKAGVKAIAIHARTSKQMYSGLPRWELLKDLRLKMNVPLIISGNIFTLEDAINALEITKADAVMVARGGVGNPFLITQISHYYKTKEVLPSKSMEDNKEYALQLAKLIFEEKGEEKGALVLRHLLPDFFKGWPDAKRIRSEIATSLKSFKDLERILS